jgi:hypothetical protein
METVVGDQRAITSHPLRQVEDVDKRDPTACGQIGRIVLMRTIPACGLTGSLWSAPAAVSA